MKLSDRIKLCRKELGLAQSEVAKRAHVSQPSYQRIEKGNVENPKRLNKLSEVLQTTPEWLKYGIGNPPSYLNIPTVPEGRIPLIPWELIKKWHGKYEICLLMQTGSFQAGRPFRVAENDSSDLQKIEFISIPNKKNAKQFAVKVKGDSMISSLPGKKSFLENDIIIVDPEMTPERDNFVIALQKDTDEAIFKQFVIDGSNQYLRPLNAQYPMILLDDSIEICGVVVAHLDVLL